MHLGLLAPLLVLFSLSVPALAQPRTWVDGRFYVASPREELELHGDLVVSFEDQLPWGSRVEVSYGLGGVETDTTGQPREISWAERSTIRAIAIGPYMWSAGIDRPLHQRDQSRRYQKLQFLLIVTLPSGRTYHVKGSDSPSGHLEAVLPEPNALPQVNRNEADWLRLPLRAVEHRN